MNIPTVVREALEESDLVRIGSCSDGIPNVNIVYYYKVIDEGKILLADNFFNKTRENIKKNPKVALSVKAPEKSVAYELKGPVKVYTEGPIFDEMKEWVLSEEPDMPAKAAVVMDVERIFDETPGEGAGQELSLDG